MEHEPNPGSHRGSLRWLGSVEASLEHDPNPALDSATERTSGEADGNSHVIGTSDQAGDTDASDQVAYTALVSLEPVRIADLHNTLQMQESSEGTSDVGSNADAGHPVIILQVGNV